MSVGRVALRSIFALAVFAGGDWLLARLVLSDDLFLGRPVAPFDPPLFSGSQHEALTRIEEDLASAQPRPSKFDAELGWCNRPESGFGEFRYDWAGARLGAAPLAHVKAPETRRVVAVGCSMTHGEEVGAADSWCARTAAQFAQLEIANLGVAAYGIDQALLRLRRDGWPLDPDEVWLGILPQAALRVTTLFRPLLDHWSLDVAFKPRFRLDAAGELELVPNPARSLDEAVRLLRDQRHFLAAMGGDDPWVARAPLAYAPRGSSWTHGSFAARLILTAEERQGRELAACFDDRSEFGRLYTAIVRTLEHECTTRGVVFRLIILPGADDLDQRREEGRGYWEDWVERRRVDGMRALDLSASLSRSELERARLFAPGGHYTAEASELVAHTLAEELGD